MPMGPLPCLSAGGVGLRGLWSDFGSLLHTTRVLILSLPCKCAQYLRMEPEHLQHPQVMQ